VSTKEKFPCEGELSRCVFCLCCLAPRSGMVVFYRFLDPRRCLPQIVQSHGRMEFDVGIEGKEPGLSHRGDLGGFFQIKENISGPFPALFREISRLRLQFIQDRVDGLGQASVADGCVSTFNGDRDLQQATHVNVLLQVGGLGNGGRLNNGET